MRKVAVLVRDKKLAKEISERLEGTSVVPTVLDPAKNPVSDLYHPDIAAVILDSGIPGLPLGASQDIINSLGRRMPVLVIDQSSNSDPSSKISPLLNYGDHVALLKGATAGELVATLHASGVGNDDARSSWNKTLPFYNPQIAVNLLKENQGLGVLAIDASSFRDVEIEFGTDVFNQLRSVFQTLLFEMWGRPGCFRANDIICRRSSHGNIYYVLLRRPRDSGKIPRPGRLEFIAKRLNRQIINALWAEAFARHDGRRLPRCIKNIPVVSVGFSSVVYNPCLDEGEIINTVLETSVKNAKVQRGKIENLQRELMHTLIDGEELLHPKFQGIFDLRTLTKKQVEDVAKYSSIKPLKDLVYGFESLIRVRTAAVEGHITEDGEIIDPKFLRPDVLFHIAKSVNVGLELDQVCIKHAANAGKELPGQLMINILPRNLYFFEQLRGLFEAHKNVVFEVSESEAISNFELMSEVRDQLRKSSIGLAADDFGRGFAGLERVIQIEPDIIKFDRSLVQNIHLDPIKQAYVTGLVEAAKILGAVVLAEGVEMWEEAEVLQAMGIDLIQGFLLHQPQSVEAIEQQLGETKDAGAAKPKKKKVGKPKLSVAS